MLASEAMHPSRTRFCGSALTRWRVSSYTVFVIANLRYRVMTLTSTSASSKPSPRGSKRIFPVVRASCCLRQPSVWRSIDWSHGTLPFPQRDHCYFKPLAQNGSRAFAMCFAVRSPKKKRRSASKRALDSARDTGTFRSKPKSRSLPCWIARAR